MKKYHVCKGDKIVVIAGDFKGEEATVRAVLAKNDRVVVEFTSFDEEARKAAGKRVIGMRTVAKARRKQDANPGMIQRAVSVHVSNVALTEEGKKAKQEKQAAWRAKKAGAAQE